LPLSGSLVLKSFTVVLLNFFTVLPFYQADDVKGDLTPSYIANWLENVENVLITDISICRLCRVVYERVLVHFEFELRAQLLLFSPIKSKKRVGSWWNVHGCHVSNGFMALRPCPKWHCLHLGFSDFQFTVVFL